MSMANTVIFQQPGTLKAKVLIMWHHYFCSIATSPHTPYTTGYKSVKLCILQHRKTPPAVINISFKALAFKKKKNRKIHWKVQCFFFSAFNCINFFPAGLSDSLLGWQISTETRRTFKMDAGCLMVQKHLFYHVMSSEGELLLKGCILLICRHGRCMLSSWIQGLWPWFC